MGGHDVGSPPAEVEVEEEEEETETQAERISEAAFSIKEASTTRPIDKSMIPRSLCLVGFWCREWRSLLDPRNKKSRK
jgi:hypothetical protein